MIDNKDINEFSHIQIDISNLANQYFDIAERWAVLMDYLNLGDIHFQVENYGPFGIMGFNGCIYAICNDTDEFEPNLRLYEAKAYHILHKPFSIISAQNMLAVITTRPAYTAFHDKMGFAIQHPFLYTRTFLILGEIIPNYRNIKRALDKAGFKYTIPI